MNFIRYVELPKGSLVKIRKSTSLPRTQAKCHYQPLIFIHGFGGGVRDFNTLAARFIEDGYPPEKLYRFGYDSHTSCNIESAKELEVFLTEVSANNGGGDVSIIAFSNGGLVARWCRQKLDGGKKIKSLITLGSPNKGSMWAYGWNAPSCIQMRPFSIFLMALGSGGCDHSFWSATDELVFPATNAISGDSSQTENVSHQGLLTTRSVYDEIHAKLRLMNKCDAHS